MLTPAPDLHDAPRGFYADTLREFDSGTERTVEVTAEEPWRTGRTLQAGLRYMRDRLGLTHIRIARRGQSVYLTREEG